MTQTVLVTGAGGFIGRRLIPELSAAGWRVRTAGRDLVGDLSASNDWRPFLEGAHAVVHLAARVHKINEQKSMPKAIAAYDRANREGTINLGEQSAAAGVNKFIFLSSVKVHGEQSDTPLAGPSLIAPGDPYAIAKADAEHALLSLPGDMGVTILRPPLVYGPYVKGNFLKLIHAVEGGWPLPLGNLQNRRSLIFIGNLTNAIRASLTTPPGIYLPSDGPPISTTQLIRYLCAALKRPTRLIPCPVSVLQLAGLVTGTSSSIQRLVGSLVVDGKIPDWTPPFNLEQGLQEVANWRANQNK